MINKYMKQLYKEVEQIRRKLISGKMKYFGKNKKDFANAFRYVVLLKDGSYFYIDLGTKNIPKIKKKSVAYISKQISYCSLDREYVLGYKDFIDTDNGFVRFTKEMEHNGSDYETEKFKQYKCDYNKNIYTGEWD